MLVVRTKNIRSLCFFEDLFMLSQYGCMDVKLMLKSPKESRLPVFFGIVRQTFVSILFVKGSPTHQYIDILKFFCYF